MTETRELDHGAAGGDVPERVLAVRARIATACQRHGRSIDSIRLIGVSKRQPIERVNAAWRAGVRDFGENTAQGLRQRLDGLPIPSSAATPTDETQTVSTRAVTWHFIGHLQRNKVNAVIPHVAWLHSLDRWDLAETLSARIEPSRPLKVLIQVNIGREPQKHGVAPDETVAFARAVAALPGLELRGLMVIPPEDQAPAPYFAATQALWMQVREVVSSVDQLSMGMSQDFDEAIRFGSTMVRVGTQLFGERQATEGIR